LSLLDAAERFSAIDRSVVMFNAERCLHKQDRFSGCEACFAVCPVEAITPGKPPSLDADKCQSCLACLTVCPMGAYSADDAVASLLNAVTHLEEGTLEILCEKNPRASKGMKESTGMRVRGCLAGLGCGAYLSLAAFGLEHILARTDACPTCVWGSLPAQVEEQVNQAKLLLEAWGKAETLECVSELDNPVARPLWEAKNPPLSRRDMFRMLTQQGKVVMARAMENGQGSESRGPGRNHMRILGAVTHLPAVQPEFNGSVVNMDFAWISVSEACTACGVCARACPTQAIQFVIEEDSHSYQLNISPQLCTGCEMCSHVCEPEAVSVEHAPTFQQVFGSGQAVLLRGGEIAYCERCKTVYAAKPGIQLCSICEFRRQNPFGSKIPKGLKIIPGKKNIEASK
jgi:ferredoxin